MEVHPGGPWASSMGVTLAAVLWDLVLWRLILEVLGGPMVGVVVAGEALVSDRHDNQVNVNGPIMFEHLQVEELDSSDSGT